MGFVTSISGRFWLLGGVLASVITVAGCAIESVEFSNRMASAELERRERPPGSVDKGWRVFQAYCAGCHGADARGTERAPNLIPVLAGMGARRFASVVLHRYERDLYGPDALKGHAALEALVEDIVRGREPPLAMPQWQGHPSVSAHVMDLYAYLSARVEGAPTTPGPVR